MEDMPVPLDKPKFFSVEDIAGNPSSLFDQEYAASLNFSSLSGSWHLAWLRSDGRGRRQPPRYTYFHPSETLL